MVDSRAQSRDLILGFPSRLRIERKRYSGTQQEFAAIGAVSVQSQRKYESGRRFPDSRYLIRISEVADIDFLLTGRRDGEESSIGERLRNERESASLTQAELGSIGGVTGKTQGLYESNRRKPDAEYLSRVSRDIDVLFVVTGQRAGEKQ